MFGTQEVFCFNYTLNESKLEHAMPFGQNNYV